MPMTDTIVLDPALWSGWYRPYRKACWRLIATDAGEERCQEKLHAAVQGGDFLVRAPGKPDPNTERWPR